MKYWVAVVCKEHALRGIAGGFMQACHGKASPLNRMKPGDHFMFYCPTMLMGGGEKIQRFVGFGKVKDRATYQVSMTENFHPFRRDIEFIKDAEKIESLQITALKNVKFKSKIRFGFFDLDENDFQLILKSMGLNPITD